MKLHIRRPMCLAGVVVIVFLTAYLGIRPPNITEYASWEGQSLTVIGTVANYSLTEDRMTINLTDISIEHHTSNGIAHPNLGLIVYIAQVPKETMTTDAIRIGSRLKAKGTVALFDVPANEGEFDSRTYYAIRGFGGMLYQAELIAVTASHSVLRQRLYMLSQSIEEIYKENFTDEDAGVLCAMVLGDRKKLDSNIKDLYSDAGIAHVLSLSGLHIAIIGVGLMKMLMRLFNRILRRIKANQRMAPVNLAAALPSMLLLLLYWAMTGGAVSSLRAIAMFVLAVSAQMKSRTYDLLSAASFSSIISLCVNPLYVLDAGFQLSFGAVIAIGIIAPIWEDTFERKIYGKIVQGILISISIMAGTLPINAYHFFQVPMMGALLNLAVIPLMSIVLYSAIAIAVLGTVGIRVQILCKITHGILLLYKKLAEGAVSLPGSIWIVGRPSVMQIILYYTVMAIAIAVLGRIGIDRMGRTKNGLENKKNKSKKILILLGFTIITYVIMSKWTDRV